MTRDDLVAKTAEELSNSILRLIELVVHREVGKSDGLETLQALQAALLKTIPERRVNTPGRLHFRLLGLTRFLPMGAKKSISQVRKTKGIEAAIAAAQAYKKDRSEERRV